ncbi:hypothetical protein J3R80_04360 [Aliiroseovarius sp. Z3]|uniref:hypothetical protein n=1 Tax=Aliiroseovarius sp. Z3 TaxID=2811402 RepID=UPI0023B32E0B|nr:hypothetical protein [Aliiroseovarius sp. Z3]MDE9449700.1 hypothetical protein [Aliiroseovarius sp. Z3]
MRPLLKLFCLLIFFPTILSAKNIAVKSGEHPNFSRLVVYTDLSDKPKLTRSERGFQVTTGNNEDRFRVTGVFDMIPRDRIADLTSAAGGALDIVLDCPCDAMTQTLPGGQFVIDIVDPPEALEPLPIRLGQSVSDDGEKHNQASAQSARRGLPIAVASDDDVAPEMLGSPPQNGAIDPASSSPAPTQSLMLNENGLLEQLARAAAQGLVDTPSIPAASPSENKENPPAPTDPPATDEDQAPITIPPPTTDHIRIQTSIDRDIGRSTAPSRVPDTDTACLPAQSFAIATWGGGDSEALDFTTHKTSLTTELDKLDSDTLRSFIQHQIYLTLGAEAQSYLASYGGILQNAEDLQLMAEIVETGTATRYAHMTAQLACDGPVALWAVLSQPRLPRDYPINTAAVISEFSILPRHLRIHLGPMVMRKFLAIGDTDTSIEINRISQRGIETLRTENTLADAQLLLKTGSGREGREQLVKIVESDDQNAVDAVLLLIDNHIETQSGIPDRTLELLSSLAHEHKTSAMGDDLAIAEIRGLIHAARFNEARANMRKFDLFPDREDGRHLQILNEFGLALSESGADGIFLRNTIGQPIWADAEEATRISVANRLLNLGFAAAAKEILVNQPAPPGRAARVLIAKAALSEGQAKVALGYLSGLNDAESQKMREAALVATEQVTTPTTPVALLPNDIAGDPAPEISLEAFEGMINDSKAVRARIQDALQSTDTP